MLLGIFGSSICLISKRSQIISKRRRCCGPRPNWKLPKKWRRRKLNYWPIRHCKLRPNNRPPRLDVSLFPLPYCAKHQLWRIYRARAKAFFKLRRPKEFLSVHKDVYHPWESEGVSKTAMDSFYDDEN